MNPSPPKRHCLTTGLLLLPLLGCHAAAPPSTSAQLDVAVPANWASPAGHEGALTDTFWRAFGDAELDATIERALRDNRDLRAALARLEAAAAARTAAGGAAWPEIDANFDAARARRLFLGFPFGGGGVPSTTVSTYGLALGLRWELDVWGRIRAGEGAAIADQQAALADLEGARLSLVAQLCRAWFRAAEAQQQVTLAEATVRAFAATADDVRERFRSGVRPALDVHQAAGNLATAEANLADRRNQLAQLRRQIDVLVGRYPDGRTTIAANLPTALPPVPTGLPSELLQRRPDLVAAERRLAAAGCRVDAAKAALYPRLSLTAGGGTNTLELQDLVDDDFRIWNLGANLLAPLFRGGALRAEVDRQVARAAEAAAGYGGAVLRAFAEVEDVLTADGELAARADQLRRAAAHASAAQELATARYQTGLVDFVTVADSQRQAFQTESSRLLAARLQLENRIDLYLALGGGYGLPDNGAKP